MKIKNISDLTAVISKRNGENLYFRGQKNGISEGWFFLPTFYRAEEVKNFTPKQELNEVHLFVEKNPSYFKDIVISDTLSVLNVLQHHGYYTKIMDLTSNVLTALFFALDGYQESDKPVVYMFEPRLRLTSNYSAKQLVEKYYDSEIVPEDKVCLINGENSHERIKNQNGDFLFFFNEVSEGDLDKYFEITEFYLEKESVCSIINELKILGYTREKIYPSLDNSIEQKKKELQLNNSANRTFSKTASQAGKSFAKAVNKAVSTDKVKEKRNEKQPITLEEKRVKDLYLSKEYEEFYKSNDREKIREFEDELIKLQEAGRLKIFWADNRPHIVIFKY